MPGLQQDEALRASNLAFYKAFEAGDIEAMASVWSQVADVSCVHPGWEPVVGREAVLSSWVDIFRGTKSITFALRNVQTLRAGDVAWVLLVEEIDVAQSDGQRVRAASQATNLFLLESDGWKLVHHHAGPGVALPASAPSASRILH